MVPGGPLFKNMDTSVLAFLVCGMLAMAFGFATMRMELAVVPARRRLKGDSSLGAQSVRWLGGISFVVALIICCLTP
jgi:hypothetical protein